MIELMTHAFIRARSPLLKYVLSLLLTLLFSLSPPPCALKAMAENSGESSPQRTPAPGAYACILANGTFFYSDADEHKGVFLLPKSYYVRLVEYGREFCRVEYQRNESGAQRIVGYAQTSELTFVDYVPVRPYLHYVFDVTYSIGGDGLETSSFLTEITLSCVYYGDYLVGSKTYCYVLRGEEFGYIPKPLALTYDKNTEYDDYLASLTPPIEESSNEAEPSSPVTPAQIAILVVICLLVPVLAAFILKPPQKPSYLMEDE